MLRRWIADEHQGDTAALTGSNAAHLARVLRARVGQHFDISTGDVVRRGTIQAISDARVEFSLGEPVPAAEAQPVTLLLAIFKFDRFEWAVEKATELGVASIVPVVARRTDAHLASAALKRVERWRRIAHEAAQQSRRLSPPEIADPVKLRDALRVNVTKKILLAENEQQVQLRDFFSSDAPSEIGPQTVALAIGPEGGWTDDEFKLFSENGWQAASLGPTILRAETAVVASCAIVQALL